MKRIDETMTFADCNKDIVKNDEAQRTKAGLQGFQEYNWGFPSH